MLDGFDSGFMHRDDVHPIDLLALNAVGDAAVVEVGAGRSAADRSAHAITVVFDDVDDRQLPQRRHVEALVDLALVDRAVAQIGHRDPPVVAVAMSKAETGTDRYLSPDDAVSAEEILLAAEHVHRAALAVRIAAAPAGQLGHHTLRVHAAGQHMAVIAVGGDDRVALLQRGLHADDYRLLSDIEMTKSADQPHAVHLACPLLETADQQHIGVPALQRLRRDVRLGGLDPVGLARGGHSGFPPGCPEAWCQIPRFATSGASFPGLQADCPARFQGHGGAGIGSWPRTSPVRDQRGFAGCMITISSGAAKSSVRRTCESSRSGSRWSERILAARRSSLARSAATSASAVLAVRNSCVSRVQARRPRSPSTRW